MLLVYAITNAAEPPGVSGMQGSPLLPVAADGLNAIASEHVETPEAAEAGLWEYEGVIEAAMELGDVLPMRFGTVVPDESRLRAILRANRSRYAAALERVRGAVELSVRAQMPSRAAPQSEVAAVGAAGESPGTAYLQRRLEESRRTDEALAQIHAPLSALAREARKTTALPPGAFKAAYLVDRDRAREFGELIDRIAESLDGGAIACTGPWPPYSFVGDGTR
jgi:hypothetical protein